MAKTKQVLLDEAKELGLELTDKNTVKEIQAALKVASSKMEATDTEDAVSSTQKSDTSQVAKAGKRSAKALREIEELEAKEARKKAIAEGQEAEEVVKKGPAPKTRPRSERRSRSFQAAAKLIEQPSYALSDAAELAVRTSHVSFDATVELHVRLNVDPRQADQNIRDSLVLPNGTGKSVRVAVFCPADQVQEAKKAGADIAGEGDFLEQLKKEIVNFDVLIAPPSVMSQLGRYARLLGPKGLMPNPKSGTVTKDITKAIKEAKAGRVEYRVDSQGIVHLGVGKVSFGGEKLTKNIEAVMSAIRAARPNSIKGNYIISTHLSTSMGPSIKVDL